VRATSLLQTVTPAERAAIEDTAYSIAAKVVDCILDEAERCAPLAAALTVTVPFLESDGENRRRKRDGVLHPRTSSA
jgi:hypothetical protein